MIIVQQRGTKKVEPRLREIELMSHLSVALDWEFAGPQLIGETGLADRVAAQLVDVLFRRFRHAHAHAAQELGVLNAGRFHLKIEMNF